MQSSDSQHREDIAPLWAGLGARHHLCSGLELVTTILCLRLLLRGLSEGLAIFLERIPLLETRTLPDSQP